MEYYKEGLPNVCELFDLYELDVRLCDYIDRSYANRLGGVYD